MFTRQPGSHNVLPLVSFNGGHGLTVVDDWAAPALQPTLETMLRRYLGTRID